jgi:hypothetical protein
MSCNAKVNFRKSQTDSKWRVAFDSILSNDVKQTLYAMIRAVKKRIHVAVASANVMRVLLQDRDKYPVCGGASIRIHLS